MEGAQLKYDYFEPILEDITNMKLDFTKVDDLMRIQG